MESKPTSEDLLQEFLSGETSEDLLRSLAGEAENDAALAGRIGGELEFSELIRQVLRGEEESAAETLEEAMKSASLSSAELTERVCDGTATPFECNQLVKTLWDDPKGISALRQRLAVDEFFYQAVSESKGEAAFLEALETRMWAETRKDHFVEDFADRLDREISEAGPDNIVQMSPSWGRTAAAMGAVAAVVAFGAFVLVQGIAGKLTIGKTVAMVVKSSPDAQWIEGVGPDSDGKIESGQYELASGVVSLKFASGGEMTVQGPALFNVAEDESTFVYHGVAMAKAASPDTGISLRSKGLSVAEPVPLIGIDARGEYSTEAIVFSGDGGVCLADGGGCRSLFEMEAVKADLIRDKFVAIPYDPQPFSKTWELLSGVEKNMGSVRIELPGTKIEANTGEAEVQVYVENESFKPKEDMEVDQINVGQFAEVKTNGGQMLQAQGDLRSYLLQLWPSESIGEEEVEASLTFDHPVVGVIFSSDRLTSSDRSVGTAIDPAGEEFSEGRGLDSGSDQILLSDDRRTLNLKLRGENLEVDQVRVLVALN